MEGTGKLGEHRSAFQHMDHLPPCLFDFVDFELQSHVKPAVSTQNFTFACLYCSETLVLNFAYCCTKKVFFNII